MSTLSQILIQIEGLREAIEGDVDRPEVPEAGPLVYPSSGPALLLVRPAQVLLRTEAASPSCCRDSSLLLAAKASTLARPTIQVSCSVFPKSRCY